MSSNLVSRAKPLRLKPLTVDDCLGEIDRLESWLRLIQRRVSQKKMG